VKICTVPTGQKVFFGQALPPFATESRVGYVSRPQVVTTPATVHAFEQKVPAGHLFSNISLFVVIGSGQ